jgi:glycosyltransferase involved in cell wall biosynthesis
MAKEMRLGVFTHVLVQEYEYARFDILTILGRLARIPVFATFQGAGPPSTWLEAFIRPGSLRLVRRLLIASEMERARVQTTYWVPDSMIATIPNPIDVSAYRQQDRDQARRDLGIAPSARVVVSHGRIAGHAKGLDVLVDAWRRVVASKEVDEPLLLLIGDGPDGDRLDELLREVPAGTVRWHREFVLDRTALCTFLSAADTYVIASRREGFAVAPLEAMACGLPVIATDAPGLADLVGGAKVTFGTIVPQGDPAKLAEALIDRLSSFDETRSLGLAALCEVERYSLATVGRKLNDVFSKAEVP